jgi:hypothetical protein
MLQQDFHVFQQDNLPAVFKAQTRQALADIPFGVKSLVAMAGYQIEITPTIIARFPELVGKHPRGYPADATFEHVDGLTRDKMIVIAHRVRLYPSGNWMETNEARLRGLLFHEYGHAFDICFGLAISDRDEFIESYMRDALAYMRQPDADPYLLQLDQAGRQEAFAETFAQVLGAATWHHSIKTAMPHVWGYVSWLLNQMRTLP